MKFLDLRLEIGRKFNFGLADQILGVFSENKVEVKLVPNYGRGDIIKQAVITVLARTDLAFILGV